MAQVIVIVVSSHSQDYELLRVDVEPCMWKSFPLANGDVVAVVHPSAARACVTEVHTEGSELYLAWHHHRHEPKRCPADVVASLDQTAKRAVEFWHGSGDATWDIWTAGLKPVVNALHEGATVSPAIWDSLLHLLRDHEGRAAAAADELLTLLQAILWQAEIGVFDRDYLIWMEEKRDALRTRLSESLNLLGHDDKVEPMKTLLAGSWAALQPLVSIQEDRSQRLALLGQRIEALAEFLFGDDDGSEGVVDVLLRKGRSAE